MKGHNHGISVYRCNMRGLDLMRVPTVKLSHDICMEAYLSRTGSDFMNSVNSSWLMNPDPSVSNSSNSSRRVSSR